MKKIKVIKCTNDQFEYYKEFLKRRKSESFANIEMMAFKVLLDNGIEESSIFKGLPLIYVEQDKFEVLADVSDLGYNLFLWKKAIYQKSKDFKKEEANG